ncbi:tyrosine-protein phosphatase [Pseudomonas sp. EL_65y_Pfl1_R83]
MQALLNADRSYIEAALKVLDSHRGGARGWLRDEMGLSDADLARLRRAYLE